MVYCCRTNRCQVYLSSLDLLLRIVTEFSAVKSTVVYELFVVPELGGQEQLKLKFEFLTKKRERKFETSATWMGLALAVRIRDQCFRSQTEYAKV